MLIELNQVYYWRRNENRIALKKKWVEELYGTMSHVTIAMQRKSKPHTQRGGVKVLIIEKYTKAVEICADLK